ncbi:MAG TPA: DUF488 domain-containing protein [Puia sp.]|nr:DUF488 domain-containing protein [Puia sp.]
MPKHPIYTIGHGTRKISELLGLLNKFSIDFLIDVRSRPYSGFNPQFNREALASTLEQEGIKYVYMGDSLGGRPSDPSCYKINGKVDYAILRQKAIFKKGIARIKTAYEKDLRVALLCSESKPGQCHRSKLIGSVLYQEKICLQHIDENGELKGQEQVSNPESRSSIPQCVLFL